MIDKKNILNSAGMSLLQAIVAAIVMFILYRYLLDSIGVEAVGVWALVMSMASISRISEFGISGSVVKFVSKYIALERLDESGRIIQTASLFVGSVVALILLIIFPLLEFGLAKVIDTAKELKSALAILPYALISIWLTMISGVFQSGIDGCQRIDLRSGIMILSNIYYLFCSILLVSNYGLIGLVTAQASQSFIFLVVNWVILRRVLKGLPVIPYRVDKKLFKEMIGYSVHFQLTGLISLLIDPLTKALLSKFGDLSIVGYFDMATRLVNQFRSLLLSMNQVVVPIISGFYEVSPNQIVPTYMLSYRIVFYLSLPAFSGLFVIIPFISIVWIGRYDQVFVLITMLITASMFLNSLVNPAFYVNLGTGRLSWNTIGFLVMAIINGLLGVVLGRIYGGIGVVVASVIAISIGSLVILVAFHFREKIPLVDFVPQESLYLAITSISAAALGSLAFYQFRYSHWILVLMFCLLLFTSIIGIPMWRHPMRTKIVGWLN